jgi:hypothetical protein
VTIFVGVCGQMVFLKGNWNQRLCFDAWSKQSLQENSPENYFRGSSAVHLTAEYVATTLLIAANDRGCVKTQNQKFQVVN